MMPSDAFLLALADLRDLGGFTGKITVEMAQGRPKEVCVPVAPTRLVLPDRRQPEPSVRVKI